MGSIQTPPQTFPTSASTHPTSNPTPLAQATTPLLPSNIQHPDPTPSSPRPRFLIIGAGSRGNAYARSVVRSSRGIIAAVAEPIAFKRNELGRKYIWGERGPGSGEAFGSWGEWLEFEVRRREGGDGGGVDGVFVCTLDETHVEILKAIAEAGVHVHVMCEKPLATNWEDCLGIWSGMRDSGRVFGIGHVLRYSPHNMMLRKLLLEENIIGDILSIEHTEPVGWWHFSHSYVRGNWRRKYREGVGSLLTKSCHDIDFLMWLLCSPPPSIFSDTISKPHLPKTITSSGHLSYFRRSRKPPTAGNATNCLSCPAEPSCIYSAKKIYIDHHLHEEQDTGWPLKIVAPEVEDMFNTQGLQAAEKVVRTKLAEDYDTDTSDEAIKNRAWYGRCVYESDNSVCDDQVVTMRWDDESLPNSPSSTPLLPHRAAKSAVFHMTAQTQKQCERYGTIAGEKGHISYDGVTISAYDFATGKTRTWTPPAPNAKEQGHGGGDDGLARQFVCAVEAVMAGDMSAEEANRHYLGVSLEECVRSHAVVFAAEESRLKGGVPLVWEDWSKVNWRI